MLIATGLLVEFILALLITLTEGVTWNELKWVRDLPPLVHDQLLYASELPVAEQETFHDVLRNILVPRTVGSPGHRKVRQFLRQSMEQLDWHVEEDTFEAPTPHGNKVFSNIVATLDPSACHRLVLACHYDSMVHKHGVFLGATDSAVPCAQLIYLAAVLNGKLQEQKRRVQLAFLVPFLSSASLGVICAPSLPSTLEHLGIGASDAVIFSPRDFAPMPTLPILDELVFKQPPGSTAASTSTKCLRSQRSPNQFSGHGIGASVQALNRFPFAMQGDGLTVQLIFFDGEEAFVRWSSSDSLYGSRHLADVWHRNSTQSYNLEGCLPRSDIATQIDRMEVMVLLDLLGAPEPRFYSYFVDTRPVYDRLVDIESRLNDLSAMETRCSRCRTTYFVNSSQLALIEDDHIPFLRRIVRSHQHELARLRGTTCAWHAKRHVPSPARTEPLLPGATSTSRSGNPLRCHQANRIDIVKPPRKLQIQPALHRAPQWAVERSGRHHGLIQPLFAFCTGDAKRAFTSTGGGTGRTRGSLGFGGFFSALSLGEVEDSACTDKTPLRFQRQQRLPQAMLDMHKHLQAV
ncbi:glutaminyl-peptide cyclotransferase isoform X4 [Rhipicephalus microplus]|uniref:glutaminyl-peptide cyclotransferase isoform X4 n=1 Tax=Rhipicephalus microplus TaxID=6941 RepID=UPI003F6B596C